MVDEPAEGLAALEVVVRDRVDGRVGVGGAGECAAGGVLTDNPAVGEVLRAGHAEAAPCFAPDFEGPDALRGGEGDVRFAAGLRFGPDAPRPGRGDLRDMVLADPASGVEVKDAAVGFCDGATHDGRGRATDDAMLHGDGDRLRLHGVDRSLRCFCAVGVGDHHDVGANFLRKCLELRVQGCGFIRRHLRAGGHDRRRDIVRDQAIAIGQRLGRSAGDAKLVGRLDEGGALLAHFCVEYVNACAVVAHGVGDVPRIDGEAAEVLAVGAASLRVGVERLAVLLDLCRGLL